VYTQNAWDHVPPPTDQGALVAAALARQRGAPVPLEDAEAYNARPSNYWCPSPIYSCRKGADGM
jgi:tRNAThr (cytosine32-N3)-methyltransferase